MQRNNAHPTFTDLRVADLGGPRATAFFDRCVAEVPLDQRAASVADAFRDGHPAGDGGAGGGIVTDYVYDMARVSEHEHFDHPARDERRVVFADSGGGRTGGSRRSGRAWNTRSRGVKQRPNNRRGHARGRGPARHAWDSRAVGGGAANSCRGLTLKPATPRARPG